MQKKWTSDKIQNLLERRNRYKGTDTAFCKSLGIANSQFYKLKGIYSREKMQKVTPPMIQLLAAGNSHNEHEVDICFPSGIRLKISGLSAVNMLPELITTLGAVR
ncbi:MAG TPA: hypothetical protein DC049_10680 [Spirochaetia bacterium]|nr:hypothetical protein [Spirochaetia bacterium]